MVRRVIKEADIKAKPTHGERVLQGADPELYRLIYGKEVVDPIRHDLRPQRNFLSSSVLEVLGSPLADLQVEGHLGQRFAGAGANVDALEELGRARLLSLFEAEDGTLLPESHAQALSGAMTGLLSPGDTILAPEPGAGCSLLWGHKSVVWQDRYSFVRYGPDPETRTFQPENLAALVEKARPSMIVVSLLPYPRQQDLDFWRQMADQAKALLLVDLGTGAGLVPGRGLDTPASRADVVIGATHGLLRGPVGGFILCKEKFAGAVKQGLFPRLQAGSPVNLLAAKAAALREAATTAFKDYSSRCLEHAQALCRSLQDQGLDPWTGGTDFHYLLLDMRPLGLSGLDAEKRLLDQGIAVQRLPLSLGKACANRGEGILLGVQALTMQGITPSALDRLADRIASTLKPEKPIR